jgi:two-component system, OmpR family, alkaline phosphatase synthesis response regulator PhoP
MPRLPGQLGAFMYVIETKKVFNRTGRRVERRRRLPLLCIIAKRESNVKERAIEYLRQAGFAVLVFPMGDDVIQWMELLRPMLVMIQTTMAWGTELRFCQGIRRAGIPVIFLSANSSEEELILGLEAGADDYIAEPSSSREIVARVRAVIRRSTRREALGRTRMLPPFFNAALGTLNPMMKTGDIEIDPGAMKILVRGSEIEATNLEFRLLYYLANNQARVFSRNQLLDAVWGAQNNVESRSVDACVRRLRHKIEPDPLRPTYLRTVRGAGYCLKAAD